MAKRVKMKKGSMGKKALAAILAASMVLSSSAFSVLAAGQVEEVPAADVEEISLEDSPMTIASEPTNNENWAFTRVTAEPVEVELPMDKTRGVEFGDIEKQEIEINISARGSRESYLKLEPIEDAANDTWGYSIVPVLHGNNLDEIYTPSEDKEDYEVDDNNNGEIYLKGGKADDEDECANNNPHFHIKLFFKNDQKTENNTSFDPGDWFDVPITILPRNFNKLKAENVKLNWEGDNTYIYDGTYQYPKLKSVKIYPNGTDDTEAAYEIDGDQFDLVCEDSYNEDNGGESPTRIGNVGCDCNQVGTHKLGVYPKSTLVNYTGMVSDRGDKDGDKLSSKEITILPAEFKTGTSLIRAKVKPVTEQSNSADLIKEIEKNIEVRDVVLMKGSKVEGQELNLGTDYTICFPEKDGTYKRSGNNWVEGVPDGTIGVPHKLAIYSTGERNFKKDTMMEIEYEVYPDSDLRQIVKNAKLGDFKDEDKDGEFESIYDASNQYDTKNGDDLILRDGVKTLVEGKDYQVYGSTNWTNAARYELTIVGRGDYRTQRDTIVVNILPKPLWENGTDGKLGDEFKATILQSEREFGSYGTVIPEISWVRTRDNTNIPMTDGTDYDMAVLGYDSNDHRFKEVEITGKGNYTTKWTNGSKEGTTVTIGREDEEKSSKITFNHEEHLDLRDECIDVKLNKNWKWSDIESGRITISDNDITVMDTSSNGGKLKLGYQYEIDGSTRVGTDSVSVEAQVGTNTIKLKGMTTDNLKAKDYCDINGHERTISFTIAAKSKFNADFTADQIAEIPWSDKGVTAPRPNVYAVGSTVQYDEVDYQYLPEGATDPEIDGIDDRDGKLHISPGYYVVRIVPTRDEYDKNDYIEVPFRVVGEKLGDVADIVVGSEKVVYDGTEKRQAITVTLKDVNKTPLYENIDYEVKCDNCINAGTVTGTIVGINDYYGEYPFTFTIDPASIEGATVTAENQAYSDNPAVTVVVDGRTLIQDTDYTVTPAKSEDGKTATVTVTGKGNYTGTATQTATFEITEGGSVEPTPTPPVEETIKTPTITLSNKISKTKKTFTVSTCKVPGATQWQVQYSLKNTYKANGALQSSKTKTITKANRLYRQKITCNKSGKRYYVRVRAKVNGEWSAWSETADPDGLEYIKSR